MELTSCRERGAGRVGSGGREGSWQGRLGDRQGRGRGHRLNLPSYL